MRKGFTISELLVAIGLLAAVLAASTMIFHYSIDAQRTAGATAEIMRKLRTITDQLNADFAGLRKDGEIFVVWTAEPDSYERFDRIMFFANGDFQSYGTPVIRGNLARISYMLAKRDNVRAPSQAPQKRILARTQHIITSATSALPDHGLLNIGSLTPANLNTWHNIYEYDTISLEGWKNIPWWPDKAEILAAITDVRTDSLVGDDYLIGATVNHADPNSVHMLLCEGVGEFKVQGWYAAKKRWVPEVDPDGDGDLTDSDFFIIPGDGIDPVQAPGVLYPYPPEYGMVSLGDGWKVSENNYFRELLNEANFDSIPGLGRALKFTFTLYDSKGIIKGGRRFEHIVYIGN